MGSGVWRLFRVWELMGMLQCFGPVGGYGVECCRLQFYSFVLYFSVNMVGYAHALLAIFGAAELRLFHRG